MSYYEVLKGITLNAMGDSYLEGHKLEKQYTWPVLLAEKYGMELCNHGKNGSTMSNFVSKRPMVERIDAMPDNNPHIVIIEGGRNDFNNNVPMGSDDPSDEDKTTFKGAMRYLVRRLKEKYPNAMFIGYTVWNVPGTNAIGNTVIDYGTAFRQIAEAEGVRYIHSTDPAVLGVDMASDEFRARYSMTPKDVSHLNREGMANILPRFEKILADNYADFLNQ